MNRQQRDTIDTVLGAVSLAAFLYFLMWLPVPC